MSRRGCVKKGDLVLVTQLGEEGVLLSDPDSAGNVQVQAGIIKTKVPVSSLRLVDKKRRRQLSRMEKKKKRRRDQDFGGQVPAQSRAASLTCAGRPCGPAVPAGWTAPFIWIK